MMRRILVLVLFSITAISSWASLHLTQTTNQAGCTQDHTVWVTQELTKMETIKPGMTRDDLLRVFKTEGGLSTPLHRTFVSRDCPYFKVDVEFKAVARPDHGNSPFVTSVEDGRDIITRVSKPYMQFSVAD